MLICLASSIVIVRKVCRLIVFFFSPVRSFIQCGLYPLYFTTVYIGYGNKVKYMPDAPELLCFTPYI